MKGPSLDLYYVVTDMTPNCNLTPSWVPLEMVVRDVPQLVVELLVAAHGGTMFGIENSAERPAPLQQVAWFAVEYPAAHGY